MRQDGVVTLEFALLIPVVGVLLLAVLLAGVHAVDQIAVQDAARAGARSAVTTRQVEPPRRAAQGAVGDREVQVVILPAGRRPGTQVNVTVLYRRQLPWISWSVTGRAVGIVEPGV